YDLLASNVGIRPNAPAYVTGTGGPDTIMISPGYAANQATVTVMNSIESLGYFVDTSNGINVLLAGNDKVIIDGDVNTNIQVTSVRNVGVELDVMGHGATSGNFTPSLDASGTFLGGNVHFGRTSITLDAIFNSGQVRVQDVTNFTFYSPDA